MASSGLPPHLESATAWCLQRLEKAKEKEPEKYHELYEFVRVEIAAGNAESIYSNTQALLWLTR